MSLQSILPSESLITTTIAQIRSFTRMRLSMTLEIMLSVEG